MPRVSYVWIFATIAGIILGAIGGWIGGAISVGTIGQNCSGDQGAIGCFLGLAIVGGILGFCTTVGIPQWIILRRFFPRSVWWLLATGLGWGCLSLGFAIANFSTGGVNILFIGLWSSAIGMLMGWLQALILQLPFKLAYQWILSHLCFSIVLAIIMVTRQYGLIVVPMILYLFITSHIFSSHIEVWKNRLKSSQ